MNCLACAEKQMISRHDLSHAIRHRQERVVSLTTHAMRSFSGWTWQHYCTLLWERAGGCAQ